MTELTGGARIFERNDRLVIEAFQRGEFDFLEGVGELSETDFFRAIAEKKVLAKLAATYPSPSKNMTCRCGYISPATSQCVFTGSINFMPFPM